MKKMVLSILLFSALNSFANSNDEIVNQTPTKIEKYKSAINDNILELPVNFAKDIIINPQDRKKLSEKTIHQIDLVYTKFKASENFNQLELNNQRIEKLKSLIPVLKNDNNITWNLIEQESATTKEDAAKLFHGFVIHFGKSIDHKTLNSCFEELQKDFTTYNLSAEKGGTITYESGSTVHFEPNSITYEDGTPVKGNIEVSYREFRNPAEILFSGIPMTYTEKGEKLNFNSGGMFELRAKQNGKNLKLNKPAIIDFVATEILPDMNYYAMDDQNGQWKKVKSLEDNKTEPRTEAKEIMETTQNVIIGNGNNIKDKFNANEDLVIVNGELKIFKHQDNGNRKESTLLASGADKGHTYPTLVRGLQSQSFGVYNCDQAFRIENRVNISAKFIDKNTKEEIQKQHVLCLLDLKYNGSFSFAPNFFYCDSKGKNMLVLFTEDKNIYLLNKEDFTKMNISQSGEYIFELTDVTNEVKSTEDLKKLML